MNKNFDTFDEYAMKYDMNIQEVAFKYNHSYRVTHQAEEIARTLKLDGEDKELASLIALLHDVARFKQWIQYRTFEDHKSFDHGDEAVKILFEDNEIEKYTAKKEDYEIIKKAIKYHNKFKYNEEEMTEREKLHAKIIRDADKIDILYSFSTNRLLEIEEDDNPISENVSKNFMNNDLINSEDVQNKNDKLLRLIAFIYDINYEYSFRKIYEEDYIGKIYEHLSNKDIFKPYIDKIKDYMKGKIENAR